MNTNENSENVIPVLNLVNNDYGNVIPNMVYFDEIIGQNETIEKLKFFVNSHSKETPFPTMLFSGSQGLGKSYTAFKISQSLCRDLIEVNCSSIETVKDLIEEIFLTRVMGSANKTILFDESHQLAPEIATFLLSCLNPNKDYCNYISYKGFTIKFDLCKINVIFATTDAHKMFRPLVNRCEEIYFRKYSNAELFKMINFYIPNISFQCDENDVSYACRGRARDTFLLSQNIKRYCVMNKKNAIGELEWNEIKKIFNVFPLGLNYKETYMMKILSGFEVLSSKNIAIKMGVNQSNVEEEIEVRPKELGLIENNAKGRYLTEDGIEYVKSYLENV